MLFRLVDYNKFVLGLYSKVDFSLWLGSGVTDHILVSFADTLHRNFVQVVALHHDYSFIDKPLHHLHNFFVFIPNNPNLSSDYLNIKQSGLILFTRLTKNIMFVLGGLAVILIITT